MNVLLNALYYAYCHSFSVGKCLYSFPFCHSHSLNSRFEHVGNVYIKLNKTVLVHPI